MLCLTPALLAIAPSDRLSVETTSFNLTLDDGASRAKQIAAETWKQSVEIRRAVFVTFAVLSGADSEAALRAAGADVVVGNVTQLPLAEDERPLLSNEAVRAA